VEISGRRHLVVRNGAVVNGGFRGKGYHSNRTGVGFRVVGEENKEVYGAVMINETARCAYDTDDLGASWCYQMFYSRSALDRG
jgi:hypothetical protein